MTCCKIHTLVGVTPSLPQKRPPKTPYVPNEDDIIVESMFLDPNTYENNMEIQNYQDNEMMDQDEIEE